MTKGGVFPFWGTESPIHGRPCKIWPLQKNADSIRRIWCLNNLYTSLDSGPFDDSLLNAASYVLHVALWVLDERLWCILLLVYC